MDENLWIGNAWVHAERAGDMEECSISFSIGYKLGILSLLRELRSLDLKDMTLSRAPNIWTALTNSLSKSDKAVDRISVMLYVHKDFLEDPEYKKEVVGVLSSVLGKKRYDHLFKYRIIYGYFRTG